MGERIGKHLATSNCKSQDEEEALQSSAVASHSDGNLSGEEAPKKNLIITIHLKRMEAPNISADSVATSQAGSSSSSSTAVADTLSNKINNNNTSKTTIKSAGDLLNGYKLIQNVKSAVLDMTTRPSSDSANDTNNNSSRTTPTAGYSYPTVLPSATRLALTNNAGNALLEQLTHPGVHTTAANRTTNGNATTCTNPGLMVVMNNIDVANRT